MKKHIWLIVGVLIISALFQAGRMLIKPSTPESISETFIQVLNHPEDFKKLEGIVSESDFLIIKKTQANFIGLLPFKKGSSEIKITKITPLSNTSRKIDFISGEKGYTINLNQNPQGSWVFNLELAKEQKRRLILSDLQDAQAEGSLEKMLTAYEELKKIDTSEDYSETITNLKEQIRIQKISEDYPDKIRFSSIKVDGKLITAQVENLGELSVSKIFGRIDIFNNQNELVFTQEAILFEVIPGSFVYGKKIQPQFSKKIGVELSKPIDKHLKVQFSVIKVQF